MPLLLPPLRERRGDIRLLAEHLVRQHGPREVELKFTPAALKALREHPWPGNVRKLRNVVLRALLLRKGPTLDSDVLTFEPAPEPAPGNTGSAPLKPPEGMTLHQAMQHLERHVVEDALRRCGYHRRSPRSVSICSSEYSASPGQ